MKKQSRKNLALKTKKIILTDRYLENFKNSTKKPFNEISIELGCRILANEKLSKK